jgi:hypothetical protein
VQIKRGARDEVRLSCVYERLRQRWLFIAVLRHHQHRQAYLLWRRAILALVGGRCRRAYRWSSQTRHRSQAHRAGAVGRVAPEVDDGGPGDLGLLEPALVRARRLPGNPGLVAGVSKETSQLACERRAAHDADVRAGGSRRPQRCCSRCHGIVGGCKRRPRPRMGSHVVGDACVGVAGVEAIAVAVPDVASALDDCKTLGLI